MFVVLATADDVGDGVVRTSSSAATATTANSSNGGSSSGAGGACANDDGKGNGEEECLPADRVRDHAAAAAGQASRPRRADGSVGDDSSSSSTPGDNDRRKRKVHCDDDMGQPESERCYSSEDYDGEEEDEDGQFWVGGSSSEDEDDDDAYFDSQDDSEDWEDDESDSEDYENGDDDSFDNWSEEKKEFCNYDSTLTPRKHRYLANVWQSGDLSRMYERILEEYRHSHNATVHSRPTLAPEDAGKADDEVDYLVGTPWVLTMENFVTPEEATRMIEWAEIEIRDGAEWNSDVQDLTEEEYNERYKDEDEEEKGCKSIQAWCQDACMEDPVVQNIVGRVEKLVGLSSDYLEELHFIRYNNNGQGYSEHSDFLPGEAVGMQGPRLFTLYIYWNDVPRGMGGETTFPHIKDPNKRGGQPVAIEPKLGRLLLWPNVLDQSPGLGDTRTRHEAKPIATGLKYGSTFWFHLRNYSYVSGIECLRDD